MGIRGWPGRAALAALVITAPLGAQEHEPRERSITVNATGTVQVKPDEATVLLAVETVAATAQDAAARNAEKMERVIAAVRALGIPAADVRTVSYDLTPVYQTDEPRREPRMPQESDEPRITGYRAANMVEVTMGDVALPGRIIDAGLAAGANRVAGLSFGVKDQTAARQEALARAVMQARAEATAVAAAAGETLGQVLHVTVGDHFQPVRYRMAAMDEAAGAPTPIAPGELTVSAMVSVVFALGSH